MAEAQPNARSSVGDSEDLKESTLNFNGKSYLDGRASDPSNFGWMRGAPPLPERQISYEGRQAHGFPQIRWTLSHVRELVPTVNVWRGSEGPSLFERSDKAKEIENLRFVDSSGETRRFEDALYDTYTDGIAVLHRGRLVYERYFGELRPHVPHACFSVTKSFAGTLTAAFVHEGVLDDSKLIPHYLPELQRSAWSDATLRQVMDMQTGLDHSEDYVDENSGVNVFVRASSPIRPKDGPRGVCEYLQTVGKRGEHGSAFAYKTINTEVMSWVMERVTGNSFAQLLEQRLWGAMGCEEDASITVDSAGKQKPGGGLNATLRDLARFGELMRREGEWNGKQLIPASVVHDVRRGGDRATFAKGAAWLPGYSYRSMWWVSHNELGAIEARGVHGQRMYVAPNAEMVVARFASHPLAGANGMEPITGPLLLALGRMLRS